MTAAHSRAAASPALHEQLLTFVGLEAEPPIAGRDEVNTAMIRAWCDAMGDGNPAYLDPVISRQVHGGMVAPPSMLMCWFFPAVGTARPPAGSNLQRFTSTLHQAGYVSVVATNVAQTHHRYARVGDSLVLSWTISSVSPEKRTSLGLGFFIRTLGRVCDQDDGLVGEIDYTRLYFKPGSAV